MPFISTPLTALVELVYIWREQVVENTLYFEDTTTPSEASLEALAEGMLEWWREELQEYLSTDISLRTIRATSQVSNTAPSFELNPTTDNAGEQAGGSVVSNATWAVQFKTALRGRSFRGRNYIPGIPESQRSGDYVTGAWALGVVGAYAQLLNATYVGSNELVVVSKYTDGAPRATGLTTPVTGIGYADLVIDSQRRRLPGRGS